MSLLCHCISLASALFPPTVSANLCFFTSFFFSAFLLLSATLPHSHRGLVWVINSWHSLGSTSQLQWRCVRVGMSFYAHTNVSWQTAEGMKHNTDMKKKKEKEPTCRVQDYFPAREAALVHLPSEWMFIPNKVAQQGATAGSYTRTSWRVVTQLPSSRPPCLLTRHQHQTPGSGGRVG